MPRRVLITGITGFAGSHLAERFVASGVAVYGIALDGASHPNLAAVSREVQVRTADITSLDDVRAAVEAARPDVVLHLAGQAIPTLASRDPVSAVRVNVLGTATVLTALEETDASFVLASSGDVYGAPARRSPVDEGAPLHPENPYAATKVAAEALTREVGERGERPVVILRATNQIGPRQHPGLAASAFAKQIAEAEAGAAGEGAGRGATAVVRHGSLDARRDFVDVRDMADAYVRAADIDARAAHVFNVGTGRAVAIADILAMLVDLARVKIRLELDPERVRAGVAPHLSLDASRFRAATGWEPKIELKQSLSDLLDYWREQVSANAVRPANV